jgi:hypothetical protein
MRDIYCHNTECKWSAKIFTGVNLCSAPAVTILIRHSDDMYPHILRCASFEVGKSTNKDIRDKNGYYPGQRKEPS